MTDLIFGSTALKYWCLRDFKRNPSDLDIISKTGQSNSRVEYHWVDAFQYILDNNKNSMYVDLDFLYTIKISHAAWDIHWDKTMHDIMFMKEKGAKLDLGLYNLLFKEWEVKHRPKRIKLEGDAETFFNKNVSRAIPHDHLHEIVKFYDRPLHELIREDKDNVKVSKALWNTLSHEDRIKCALEETYVFALERYSDKDYPKIAFNKAIKHLITLSTKGFFNLFLLENFKELVYSDKTHYLNCYKLYKEKLSEQEKSA